MCLPNSYEKSALLLMLTEMSMRLVGVNTSAEKTCGLRDVISGI